MCMQVPYINIDHKKMLLSICEHFLFQNTVWCIVYLHCMYYNLCVLHKKKLNVLSRCVRTACSCSLYLRITTVSTMVQCLAPNSAGFSVSWKLLVWSPQNRNGCVCMRNMVSKLAEKTMSTTLISVIGFTNQLTSCGGNHENNTMYCYARAEGVYLVIMWCHLGYLL